MNREKIVWKKDYSVGNESIDKDHKRILNIYNQLVTFVSQESSRDECAKILKELTKYSEYHFKKEENYMKEFSYPRLDEHRRYHKEFIFKVSMFYSEFTETESCDANSLLKFLKEWLTEHIMKIDKDFEKFKKSVDSRARY